MDKLLDRLDPIVAILVLGNALQYVYNRKDIDRLTGAVSGLTTSLTQLSERLKGGEK